jgi:hypothetical protein
LARLVAGRLEKRAGLSPMATEAGYPNRTFRVSWDATKGTSYPHSLGRPALTLAAATHKPEERRLVQLLSL